MEQLCRKKKNEVGKNKHVSDDQYGHNGDDSLNKSRLIMTLLPFNKGEEEGEFFGDSFCAASVMADNLCCRWRFPIFMFRCLSVSNWV